ncbi:MAG: hypothetical protein DI539_02325 [Flavobacterium psychrophilum]|nr:MAG: hypothetical protein DI539_02325 [Flavobacterium psychrophilum]
MKTTNIICVHEVKANKASTAYAILFLFLTLLGIFMVAYPIYTGEGYGKVNYMMITGVVFSSIGLVSGLPYLYASRFYFDLEKGRYKHAEVFGPFVSGDWKNITGIEYVSVFGQFYTDQEDYDEEKNRRFVYDINLWYDGDRYITLTTYYSKLPAFNFAKRLATQLNIKMLDSTVPNNSVWVELNNGN